MWLYIPSECLNSAPVPDSMESPSAWWLEALASSATWRGKSLPPRSWSRVWRTVHWMRHLSGLTSEPSTADDGVARWIASWADSPASHTVSPGSNSEPTTNVTSGPNVSESFARQALDMPSSRTWAAVFGSTTDVSALTLKALATASRKSSARRRMSARRTAASGSSSSQWQTPSVADVTDGHANRGGDRSAEQLLVGQARNWSTPTGHDGRRPGSDETSTQGRNLKRESEMWSIPTTRDYKDGANTSSSVATNSLLGRQAPMTLMPGDESSPSGPTSPRRLNPRMVEWLMGWREGWISLAPINSASSGTE